MELVPYIYHKGSHRAASGREDMVRRQLSVKQKQGAHWMLDLPSLQNCEK